ncbi:MAG: diacylglycerol kinase family protein [Oscillospiraceae bacterium]|nr:diacylglycerol kinase family protein [Oscillospiraceae bacterium]MDD4413774.1 diacylglycerol kinase family protein [Oscillospiraceae bacterium]
MKHVFIINPAAGKNKRALGLIPEIREYFEKNDGEHVIEVTKAPMDAARLAGLYAQKGEHVRLYSCGGDGTLMETLNGAFGCENTEIACIPCGSANDYIKNFDAALPFKSVGAQVRGEARQVDTIDCNGRISFNICCMGMDADVADKMRYFKHFPLVTGRLAYNLAVVYMFFQPIGRRLNVSIETENGMVEQEGNYLFSLAASGQYYGGGYHGAPQAVVDDGLLDFLFVDSVSHIKALGFIKRYKAGKHLDMPIVHSCRGNKMVVTSPIPVTVCIDGECFSEKEITFTIRKKSARFIIPEYVKKL